ncbi:MAG TPA: glycosyl hydrolase, partial [Fimbriimonas sp.]|nr:glycosyl hydrolase [Fimbriimonas sp.]
MLTLFVLASALAQPAVQTDALAAAFKNPPASAKPHTWWHWMDGNITKSGITKDLEAMKASGLGGAHIFDVGQGVPAGPINYNTEEWRELMVFALEEAKRLNLDMTMHNCAGWSSSAGPWVAPTDAMKKVTFATTDFTGPGRAPLPDPPKVRGYYQDILIVAVPQTSSTPGVDGRNELTGLGANPGQVDTLNWPKIDMSRARVFVSDSIAHDHDIDTQLPSGKWTILRMGVTLTGAQNVASRDSGRGLEVDKLNAGALDRFFAGGMDPLFDKLGANSALHTVLVDSYETGYNNWTPGMFDEFKRRRGYEATQYLPALAGFVVESQEKTLGFLFDYRKTIAELWAENYSGHFANKLKERGFQLAIEPYGNGNFDPFTFAKPAGLIMGEYWVGDSNINPSVKHASSVAHVYGHSVVGAEALTASPEQAGWRNQPKQWKPYADHAMTLGINRIIYHRFAHQPFEDNVLPGMTMGPWGSHVDRTNTIWPYMNSWNMYLTRSQYLLQQGKFVGDILMFAGEDSPQSMAGEGQKLPQVPEGYDFDYIGQDPLMSLTVKNGRIVLPNGGSYALLVLPDSKKMTLPVALKIKQIVELGGNVLGPKPTTSPSLSEEVIRTADRVQMLSDQVWGKTPKEGEVHMYGSGRVFVGSSLTSAIAALKIPKDFSADAKDVRSIHRRIGARDAYFVASSQPYPRIVNCQFRSSTGNVQVQLWDATTGAIQDAPVWRKVVRDGKVTAIEVPLALQADGSMFVMISPSAKVSNHLTKVEATPYNVLTKALPKLTILKATYGDAASGKVVDVTSLVAKAGDAHSLRMIASNGALGGDPAYLVVKKLVVTYQLGNETKTVTIPENGTLSLGNLPDAGSPPVYELKGGAMHVWQNGDFKTSWSTGKSATLKVRDIPAAATVKGPWQARFPSGWDAPEKVTFDKLMSWTDHTNFGVKHFSGTVRYSNTISVTAAQLAKGKRLILDLGDVRELCRVRLNGIPLGALWGSPYRVDITEFAKVGKNSL